ncbi:MAG: hypothetical protein Q8S00_18575 [Deltaproteobacteria bacterium]|nr:hypothetical protein [Deltaproteobacteria bacterium]
MGRILTAAELPLVFAAVNDRISDYAIGFVKILPTAQPEDATVAGSGTLVTAGGRHTILTAAHVLDALPSNGEIGLILPTRFGPQVHRATLEMNVGRKVTLGPASYDRNGPDLGLILLAQSDISKLPSSKTFYNLDKRREQMLSAPRAIDMGGWFLCGMVGEWTSDLSPECGFARVKAFRGVTGAGVVVAERQCAEFDYLEFEAKYNAAYEGPDSFGGVSGGGLWQVVFEERDGAVNMVDALLSGVVFFQSEIVGDTRTIFCHGRRSIYERVADSLRSAAS